MIFDCERGIFWMRMELVLGVVGIAVARRIRALSHVYGVGALERRMRLENAIAAVCLEQAVVGCGVGVVVHRRAE